MALAIGLIGGEQGVGSRRVALQPGVGTTPMRGVVRC